MGKALLYCRNNWTKLSPKYQSKICEKIVFQWRAWAESWGVFQLLRRPSKTGLDFQLFVYRYTWCIGMTELNLAVLLLCRRLSRPSCTSG